MNDETIDDFLQTLERMTTEEVDEYLEGIEEQERNYEYGSN